MATALSADDQVMAAGGFDGTVRIWHLGTPDSPRLIDPQRALIIETAYVTSFLDLHLRHRDNHLLDGQSTQFPEMLLQP